MRRVATGQSSDEPVPAALITKGYEYEQGRYVTLASEELRAIVPPTSADMEIVEFVRLAEIDPVYFEASYYVKPEEPGRKPYALLYEAMREAGFAAVGSSPCTAATGSRSCARSYRPDGAHDVFCLRGAF